MAAGTPAIGQTLGRYQVLEQIGAGGMGLVFRAHDQRLERDVALKVLPPGTLTDEQARKRFRQEALALSKLNHPNIGTVHDFDTQDGIDFLVMELISGLTLDEMLKAGPLPEREVLRLGQQLAEGLAAAHQQGVVHRDLKPGNLRLTSDGRLKILDFGLAKLLHPAEADAATESLSQTRGAVGTLPYMSPEQVRAQAVDVRSDVYSAGVVLYRMCTGRLPFTGEGISVVEAILNRVPDPPQQLQPNVSPALQNMVLKCLEKDPNRRYQSARELQVDLERLLAPSGSVVLQAGRRPRRRRLATAAALAMAVVAAAMVGFNAGDLRDRILRSGGSAPKTEYEQLTNFTDSATWPTLSPDGRMLAFVRGADARTSTKEERALYVKFLPKGEPVRLAGDGVPTAFSPDGSKLAYTVVDTNFSWDTWTVPVLDGAAQPWLVNASGLIWMDDEHIVYSEVDRGIHMAIVTSSTSRANPRTIYSPPTDGGMAHRTFASPDRRWLLVKEMDSAGWLPCRLVPFDGSTTGRPVGPPNAQCTDAAWSPEGEWMYFVSNAGGARHIWRQRFPEGQPEQLTSGASEEQGLTVAPDGSLITAIGLEQSDVWISEKGKNRQISSEGYAYRPRFTPDGKQLYYLVRLSGDQAFAPGELWRFDLDSGRRERVLDDFSLTDFDLSPDGSQIVFSATGGPDRSGIWTMALNRRFPPRRLTNGEEQRPFFGPDGGIYFQGPVGSIKHVFRMKADGSEKNRIMNDPVLFLIAVSPDGRWVIAWVPVSGNPEKSNAIRAFPTTGGESVLLCDQCAGGSGGNRQNAPMFSWSPDGRRFYISSQYLITQRMKSRMTVEVPLPPGHSLPAVPRTGLTTAREALALPGARAMNEKDVFPGPRPNQFAYTVASSKTNLFRIRLK